MALTVKQRKLIKGVVEGKSKTQAGIEAGYSPKSAYTVAAKTLQKPELQRAIDIALEKRGLNDERITEVLDEGLKANRVISARITSKEADVDTDDFIEVPDHPTRHKFLDTLIDLRRLKNPTDDEKPPIQVNILIQNMIDKIYGSQQ